MFYNIRNRDLILLIVSVLSLSNLHAQTKVIAHRGYWNCEGSAQNSITSLQKAQELNIYGSEFDVWMTTDGVLVINHDGVIDGLKIEDVDYAQLKEKLLKNGEKLPLLEEYLLQGKKERKTRLILELKPHNSKEKEERAVAAVVKLVDKHNMRRQIEYISFRLGICKEFVRLDRKAKVAYLNGDLAPKELKAIHINGIDYHYTVLQKNRAWVDEARKLKMTVNVWTVNSKEIMQEMMAAGVDFITTDDPVLCKETLRPKPVAPPRSGSPLPAQPAR
ncbi:MAG: glycerophosphodiester phosphodiesterase [Bacteroidetes bacterium]|nr:glycerophosphodiester phosphodiesterase [Bacteroidota bacterium]